MTPEQLLREGLAVYGLPADAAAIEGLEEFSRRLLERNQVMNLTAITEPAAIEDRHFVDSLLLAAQPEVTGRLVDVGTGADSAAGARESLGIQFPLPIANGGTGGTTASAALTNLGLPVTYGKWTPTLISTDGGMTYTTSYSYAYYYRIGDLVYITLYMKVNVTAAGTNYARIQGLPFTPRSGFYYALARAMFATGSYNNNTDGASAFISTATNTIHIQSANGTGALKWRTGDTWVGWSGCYVKAQ